MSAILIGKPTSLKKKPSELHEDHIQTEQIFLLPLWRKTFRKERIIYI